MFEVRSDLALKVRQSIMQDIIYLLATVGFFGLMWLFVNGCDRIIGPDDDAVASLAFEASSETVSGGAHEGR